MWPFRCVVQRSDGRRDSSYHHLYSVNCISGSRCCYPETDPVKSEYGAPEKIRTSDLQLRRLPLYPAELRARSSSLALIRHRLTAHAVAVQHHHGHQIQCHKRPIHINRSTCNSQRERETHPCSSAPWQPPPVAPSSPPQASPKWAT